jgi:exopolyphosphatase/guanosine-5'-triphosphate,3'-diphosphate pyrophosphatase
MKIGAIDVGTNSFHLLIARVGADGNVEAMERQKEMVRLGDSAFAGNISDETFKRGVDALRRFREMADRAGADALVAVATSAVREAENGGEFVRVVRDETGIELNVIGGEEEARLIYLGARASLNLGGKRALIVDIGGGSVELVVGDARDRYYGASLKLGVLRLLNSWKPSDPPTADERTRLAGDLHRKLEVPIAAARSVGFQIVAMSSGTARAVADLIPVPPDRAAERPRRVLFRDVYALEDRLCAMPSADRLRLAGQGGLLDAKRVDSIIPGVILIRSLLEVAHADEYLLAETALREGLVYDFVARHRPDIQITDEIPDLRRRSVVQLMRRCQANIAHSEHVARLALDLFRGTRALHNLPNSDGELLEFATLLHDIGFHIASSKHHKHAAYLIANTDLRGFASEETLLLATVVRYHRKATPQKTHEPYGKLAPALQQRIKVLAGILRVADGLDRGYNQRIRHVRCLPPAPGGRTLDVVCTTAPGDDAELELWSARRKSDLFEEVFGRKLHLVVESQAQS